MPENASDSVIFDDGHFQSVPRPSAFRDSTQIVVPCDALDGLRDDLEDRFTISFFDAEGRCRIIGSPVEIKGVSEYLSRRGVTLL